MQANIKDSPEYASPFVGIGQDVVFLFIVTISFQTEFYSKYFVFMFMNFYEISIAFLRIKAIERKTDQMGVERIVFNGLYFLKRIACNEHTLNE